MNRWLIVMSILSWSCIQFRMDEAAFQAEFEGIDPMPVSETVDVGENHMHFVHRNTGKQNLVVFIHGSPGSWSAFTDYFRYAELADFDLLSIDRPGFGDSDYGRPMASLEAQAYHLAQVINRFPNANKILVGHSLGGPVAARLLMDFPDLATSMVLVAPSIDPEMERYEWYRTWIQSKVGGLVTPTDFWVSNEEIVPLKDELTLMMPLWEKIRSRTIVIQGKKDMLVPWQNAEFAQRMLPDSLVEVRYLPDENHFIPWSKPEAILDAIADLNVE